MKLFKEFTTKHEATPLWQEKLTNTRSANHFMVAEKDYKYMDTRLPENRKDVAQTAFVEEGKEPWHQDTPGTAQASGQLFQSCPHSRG